MTRFEDGPAAGQTLTLRLCPLYLRAVRTPDGKWDALDLLDDVARAGEHLVAYRRVGEAGFAFLDYTDKVTGRRRGTSCATGTYVVVEEQPTQEVMRDNDQWRRWCEGQVS